MILAILLWLLVIPPPLPIILIHDAASPADDWTAARTEAAVTATRAALVWWEARTGTPAPALGPVIQRGVETPYDRASWMEAGEPGIFIVARAADGPTLAHGRSGWAKPGGWRLVALETPVRADAPLAALLAHEWGHAAYKLPDTPDGADIMGPDYPHAYAARRLGCASLRALGGACVALPMLRGAP